VSGRAIVAGDRTDYATVITGPAFIGREKEASALEEALAGEPVLVLVEGEAGIGKTRLLDEVLARHPGGERGRIVASCPPFRQPCTLGPVVDAVRQATGSPRQLGLSGLAGALRPLFPEWSDLPPAPEPAEDATAARYRLFRALDELFTRLEVRVLVFEDVHWADEATLEFLLFLRSQRARQPSIVVTYRPEDLPEDSLVLRLSSRLSGKATGLRLTLRPLVVAQTADLVSSMLSGRRVSREFAAFVHERTDGIPLAVEELIRLMHDRASLGGGEGEQVQPRLQDLAVPVTIRDRVLERSGRLSADARAILQAASVLADPADERMIQLVAGLSGARASTALAEVLGCGLLAEDVHGAVSFRHGLAERAIYEAMNPRLRRQLHLRAGQALQDQPGPSIAQLTRHFREANEAETWSRYAEQAADLALSTGDEATAGELLQDILTRTDLPPERVIHLIRKMPFSSLTGQEPFHDMAGRLRTVLAAGGVGPAEEADARMLLGRILLVLEERDAARAELEQAIPHLRHDSVEAARAAILLGWPKGTDWPAAVHRRWLDRAADMVESMAPADRLNLTVERASALLMLGEDAGWTVTAQIPEDASSPGERPYVVKGHLNVGGIAMACWGRDEEARRRLTKGLALAETHGYGLYRDLILATMVHLDWLAGDWEGLADRASALADRSDMHVLTRLEAILVRGLLRLAAGKRAQAAEDLQLVVTQARQLAAYDACMEPAAALARLHLADGDIDAALAATDEPMDVLARKGIWVWATDVAPARVQALIAAGRTEEAAEITGDFARGLGHRDAPAPRAALLVCQALVAQARAQHSRAATLFAQAAQAWQVPPRPYEALLARERQARCLLTAGRGTAALPILSDVVKGLSGLGARQDAMRVIRTLNEHGVQAKRPWLGGRRSYGGELSPREVDVVRLLLGGRTNRQIAEALFLSPKTVACHVYSAMHKLGVPTRAALAAWAMEAGLEAN
jgi:DNA-binding CsgD family transcriptional regulator/tetratricopeptide (TPR) repeat protein